MRVKESNPPMTRGELKKLGRNIWGENNGWQTRMAEFLGLDPSTVRRVIAGASRISGPMRAALRERARRESAVA